MSFLIPLPQYQCHKRVGALKIKLVVGNPRGIELHFENLQYAPAEMTNEWAAKHTPEPGGYLVAYEDGYVSYSPAEAFEAGYALLPSYSRLTSPGGMAFGLAIESLKRGARVARTGWNGKGMWLSLSCNGARYVAAADFWSQHNAAHADAQGGFAKVLPSITMKTATGEILMGWLASQTDMLAEDWVLVE